MAEQSQSQCCENITDPIGCSDKTGCLPSNAPLANPYVPFQRENADQYPAGRALVRGTLFPGLELPFMGLVNRSEKNGPLAELMALGFAMHELGLYLDTHQNDRDAVKLFRQYSQLYQEGRSAYERQFGPLQQTQGEVDGEYVWLKDPWPWDFVETEGMK